jgi:hypothetical protein
MTLPVGILETIGVGAALVAAVAGAVGAVAAWRSANASKDTSRDASDALALGIVPTLNLDTTIDQLEDGSTRGRWAARVINVSTQFAATDVHLEATFQDAQAVSQTTERMPPGHSWSVALRVIEMPPGGPTAGEAGTSLVLRYSDERKIARYEQEFAFLWKTYQGAPTAPTISVMPVSDPTRIN